MAKQEELLNSLLANYKALIGNNRMLIKLKMKKELMGRSNRVMSGLCNQQQMGLEPFSEVRVGLVPLDDLEDQRLKINLLKDLQLLNNQFNKGNLHSNTDIAYSEMMLRQKSRKAEQSVQLQNIQSEIYNSFLKFNETYQ